MKNKDIQKCRRKLEEIAVWLDRLEETEDWGCAREIDLCAITISDTISSGLGSSARFASHMMAGPVLDALRDVVSPRPPRFEDGPDYFIGLTTTQEAVDRAHDLIRRADERRLHAMGLSGGTGIRPLEASWQRFVFGARGAP